MITSVPSIDIRMTIPNAVSTLGITVNRPPVRDSGGEKKPFSLRSNIVRNPILPYVILLQFTFIAVIFISHQGPLYYLPEKPPEAAGAFVDHEALAIPQECDAWIAEAEGAGTNQIRAPSDEIRGAPGVVDCVDRALFVSVFSREQLKDRERESPKFVAVGGNGYGPSWLFEKCLGWSGVCVEEDESRVENLRAAKRKCQVESCTSAADCEAIRGIVDEDGSRLDLLTIDAPEVSCEVVSLHHLANPPSLWNAKEICIVLD